MVREPDCRMCPLWRTRTRVVKGRGVFPAKVFFIGEAPGIDEDQRGEAFIGRSGVFLQRCIEQAGLTGDAWMENVVACLPLDEDLLPRPPEQDEWEPCKRKVYSDIARSKPRLIVTLGETARRVFGDLMAHETRAIVRYRWYNWFHLPHPARVLREPEDGPLRTRWADGFMLITNWLKVGDGSTWKEPVRKKPEKKGPRRKIVQGRMLKRALGRRKGRKG